MSTLPSFEPLPGARHRVMLGDDGAEWVMVPARRNWFALPFLSVWLVGWTFGGIMATTAMIMGDAGERGFLAVWLTLWAGGWAFAASTIAWQVFGRHMLAVHGGALHYRWAMGPMARSKRYDAAQVRHLASTETGGMWGFGSAIRYDTPPFLPNMRGGGTIKFDYGARTVRLVPGLDEAEGRAIVARLAAKLPRGAVG